MILATAPDPEPSCDPWAAMQTNAGEDGCVMVVEAMPPADWLPVAIFFGVLVLVALGVLVVAQLRKG